MDSHIAHLSLSGQIASKECHRNYIALVDGVIKQDEGVIIANIDRNKKDRKLMARLLSNALTSVSFGLPGAG